MPWSPPEKELCLVLILPVLLSFQTGSKDRKTAAARTTCHPQASLLHTSTHPLSCQGRTLPLLLPSAFLFAVSQEFPSICEAEDTDTCDRGVSNMATESKGLHGSNSAWCWHLLCSILRFISEVPGPAQEKEKHPLSLQSMKTITHKKDKEKDTSCAFV